MKIRLKMTAVGALLCAWLGVSFLSVPTSAEAPEQRQADAHRLGPAR